MPRKIDFWIPISNSRRTAKPTITVECNSFKKLTVLYLLVASPRSDTGSLEFTRSTRQE